MLNIIYTEQALDNIDLIAFNITEFVGVYSAINVIDDIKKSIDLLAYSPEMGIAGIVLGTKEIYPRGYREFIALMTT
ncbi:type II toxin-antitoxin system RelE/ParE family toxin [Testudinibacter sp. P80/BLE/0925]|uniref:type II toxin-antitoxin system RelE/ParE family toxin n=1 Tax=Testudinibacter sp. TW-1 TaxID=3417757 RepID=UPI003D35FB23